MVTVAAAGRLYWHQLRPWRVPPRLQEECQCEQPKITAFVNTWRQGIRGIREDSAYCVPEKLCAVRDVASSPQRRNPSGRRTNLGSTASPRLGKTAVEHSFAQPLVENSGQSSAFYLHLAVVQQKGWFIKNGVLRFSHHLAAGCQALRHKPEQSFFPGKESHIQPSTIGRFRFAGTWGST